MQTFFTHMSPDSGMAFVVIQHLSPDYKSLMVELLSKSTKMQVVRIVNGVRLAANTIYLIPPAKNVTIARGRLLLTEHTHSHGFLNLPIDIFLRSLAEERGERAVAVILSGTGSDGTRGIRAIKEAGGMVMVQDPANAKFDGMPTSALGTGLADYTLPAERMPEELLKFIKHPLIAARPRHGESLASQEDTLVKIIALLGKQTGVDFTYYKPNTIVRRIERRMGIAQMQTMSDYLHYLYQSTVEVKALYQDLLIGVTKFFRDTEAFEVLEQRVIPELFRRNRSQRSVRVWVAGCATGEEAYSLAILLREHLDTLDVPFDCKVFATDIDRTAVETAGSGVYPASIVAELSEARLRRFFVDRGGAFQVTRQIREMVVFAPQNLLKDPPFTKIDLVCCRNLLIYLQPVLQRRTLSLFAFALQEGGFLFLGASETLGDVSQLFDTLEPKWKIFERRPGVPAPLDSSLTLGPARERLLRSHFSPAIGRSNERTSDDHLVETVQTKLIADFCPACFVLDENGDLRHSFGALPTIVRLPEGRATLNLVRMLPKELSLALSTALHRVLKDRERVTYHNIRVPCAGESLGYNLTVEPLPTAIGHRLMLLVYLQELRTVSASAPPAGPYDAQADQTQRITDLEQELQMSRENLQATVEELETSNEELQATNEELLAANEELQSTNEELQSVNEELYTVNAEYQNKITELSQLNNDIDNLLASADIGTLFLDVEMRIRKFTPSIAKTINLLPHDIGRPLADLGNPILQALREHVATVAGGKPLDLTIGADRGRWLLARMVPYDSRDRQPQGVVVTFIDITDLKNAEQRLQQVQGDVERRVTERTALLTREREVAETANRAKDEFLTHMSYEIRSPLASVLGNLDLVLGTTLTEPQRQQLLVAQRRSNDLLQMLDNLLELARLRRDGVQRESVDLSLRATIDEVVAMVRPEAERKGLTVQVDVPASLEDGLAGDRGHLKQVLWHLLANAVKFTHAGSVRVAVLPNEADETGLSLEFVVTDTGIGIVAEQLPLLFAEFSQAQGSHTRQHDGAGVGLALCRLLVPALGGRIWVESTPGEGSQFHFTARFTRSDQGSGQAVPGSVAPTADATAGTGKALQVLVIDDDPAFIQVITTILLHLGHEAQVACEPLSGIEKVNQGHFDVVLLDLQLPGMSGFAAAQAIRELNGFDRHGRRRREVPIVALTSHIGPDDRKCCQSVGMSAFLGKPIDRALLATTLRRVTTGRTATTNP